MPINESIIDDDDGNGNDDDDVYLRNCLKDTTSIRLSINK
jgi:hypothetical protein